MEVAFTVVGASSDGRLEGYLRDRMNASWPAADGATRRIDVTLEWLGAARFELRVEEAGEGWARRTFTAASAALELEMAAWLFVRSALARAQAEPPLEPVAAAGREEPLPATMPTETLPDTVSVTGPLRAKERAPEPISGWSPVVLAATSVDKGGAWEAGGRLGAARARDGWAVRLEAGYTWSARRALRVHRLPVALGLAWLPASAPGVALGAEVALEGKLARTRATERRALGLTLGPTIELRWPATGAGLLARLGVLARPLRQRYLIDGATIREAPWTLALAVGAALP
jgi:hypothetical protein